VYIASCLAALCVCVRVCLHTWRKPIHVLVVDSTRGFSHTLAGCPTCMYIHGTVINCKKNGLKFFLWNWYLSSHVKQFVSHGWKCNFRSFKCNYFSQTFNLISSLLSLFIETSSCLCALRYVRWACTITAIQFGRTMQYEKMFAIMLHSI